MFFYWQHPAERRTFFFFFCNVTQASHVVLFYLGAGRGIGGSSTTALMSSSMVLLRNVHQLMSNCVYAVGECSNVKWLCGCRAYKTCDNVSYLVFIEWNLCPRARLEWAEANRRPVRKRDLWRLCVVMAFSNYSNLSRAQLTFEYLHTNS